MNYANLNTGVYSWYFEIRISSHPRLPFLIVLAHNDYCYPFIDIYIYQKGLINAFLSDRLILSGDYSVFVN